STKKEQIIIPILVDEHYTVTVIHLMHSYKKKYAHIQFYNSFGEDLDISYQRLLKSFFIKKGFIPTYKNISFPDQRDDYNCGIFVIYKAIEIAGRNVKVIENLLPRESYSELEYDTWSYNARKHIENILLEDRRCE